MTHQHTEPATDRTPVPTVEPVLRAVAGGSRFFAAVRRRPLLAFLILSCLLSWWAFVPYRLGASPSPIAGFGPFLAALAVLGITQGRRGPRALLRRMVQWRVPVRCYVYAIGIPLVVSGTAVAINLALGAATPDPAKLASWSQIPITMLVVLLIPGIGGAWEEPGFRGFALRRFEARLGVTAGPLGLGACWVLWHLPLFIAGQILVTDVLTIVAASVVIAAVFHAAEDSILIAMVLHAANNAVGGSYASQLFSGSDTVRLGLLTAAGWSGAAALVIIRARRTLRVSTGLASDRLVGLQH